MAILALALVFVTAFAHSADALTQLKILIDADENPATGCTIPTPAGPFDGAEWVVTSTIDPAQVKVVALAAQPCVDGALGPLTPVTSPFPLPWPVGVGVGLGGSDVVELYVAPFVKIGTVARVGFVFDNGAGVVSALLTTNGRLGGPAIVIALDPAAIPTLGTLGVALLVVLLLISGAMLARRRGMRTGVWVTILALTAGVGVVWAAIVLDGQPGDWAGVPAVAVDTIGSNAIKQAFAQRDNGIVFIRVDGTFICDPITIDPTGLPGAGAINQAYGPVTFTQTGGQAPVTWSVTGALPTGMSFSAAGVLSGTPTQSGSFPLTFKVTDSRGCVGTQAATLVIVATSPPTITSASVTTFTVDQPGTFTVTATGLPTPSSITRGGALPAGVNFVDNADGTGTLSGTPAPGTGGPYAITFTAANGIAPDAVQNFTLAVNQAPAITSGSATTFTVGTSGSFTVSTTGFPTGASMVISETGALPTGVTFVNNGNGTATLSGPPAAGTSGSYPITITANNGIAPNATQNFTLNVVAAPTFTSVNATTFTVGAPGTFTVTAAGSPTPAIARGGVALPAGVTFIDHGNGTGTLSGTPGAGTGGPYAITFTAANGIAPDAVQNFTLAVNQAPAIISGNATTFIAGTSGSFTVTTTGFPAPSIARGGAALPADVTFVDNGDGTGTLSGPPAAGTSGIYAITFTATNAAGATPVQNFTLTVVQALTITSPNATTFTVGAAGTFTVTATGVPGAGDHAHGRPAGRCDLRRQRQRDGDAERHAGGGHRRPVPRSPSPPPTASAERRAELHAGRQPGRRPSPAAT